MVFSTCIKANSLWEPFVKSFAVHTSKLKILQIHEKAKSPMFSFQYYIDYWSFVSSFHVAFKISNFIVWFAKHLTQGYSTELALSRISQNFLIALLPSVPTFWHKKIQDFQWPKLWALKCHLSVRFGSNLWLERDLRHKNNPMDYL